MIGKKLGGRYEILSKVGGGGMAIVYKAKDLFLDRIVAVKILRAQFVNDEDFIRRFRREAQAAASLSHPNVVNIYDVGEDEEIHYIVMEYIEGFTLKQLIQEKAPLPVEEAIYIASQICEALDHAHQNHIIHRDIKPHNILIGRRGRVKVTDFGIARAVTSATITHTGSVLGSVHYFSPEQAKGGMTGEKSDIYSLGIVLYEMLTGNLPFSGESPISVALKHLQDNYLSPRAIIPSIPQSVENVVLKALAKDPDLRYRSAKEMWEDLHTVLSPERKNEPKITFSHNEMEDNQPTRIVPALSEDMIHSLSGQNSDNVEENDEEDYDDEPDGKRIWVKVIISIITVILLIGGGLLAFNYLSGILFVPDVPVPRVVSIPKDQAIKKIEEKGLLAKVEERSSNEVEEDFVIRQEPAPGSPVKANTYVTIYVSKGKEKIPMPSLIGFPQQTAVELLASFTNVVVEQEFSDSPSGKVIKQEPKAGEPVVPSEVKVTITVSQGKESFEMPSLIGKDEQEAAATLLKYDLKLGNPNYGPSYMDKGKVYRQFPFEPGDPVSRGATIDIWVSTGLPDDAIEAIEQVMVFPDSPEGTDVLIYVSDARGSNQLVYQRTIREPTPVDVKVIVTAELNGLIQVYKDGSLVERRPVQYDKVVGGD
ncbi:Stk1 family PASTA domain-containing Ser/Thr kinase [Microaerobacter geothermalis]|uniref:Stk1 family PASTA domain-containing Ser/Thr kinase n=1 Tax=Microaerobacter geothermalis TaxID=674972 RepID=UPI001F2426C0|nr:Stk1 family PASTA domain-containing Ser/Thr kinase [Microaerobacter geothermalis]MCF6094889.1 Stk1 family PASTA domain-containing Ser/Thr kinase [Microaerobacter geothermalis]